MLAKWFSSFGGKSATVGIELQAEGLALAVRNQEDNPESSSSAEGGLAPACHIAQLSFLSHASNDAKPALALAQWVDSQQLKNARCNLVLGQGDYQLLLVEAPDVDAKELRHAIRWRIKDLVSIPLEKAVLDVFLLPRDGSRSGKAMAYVAVADKSRIDNAIALVRDAGLQLAAIDVSELALRNLVCRKELNVKDSRGVALVRLSEGAGVLSLYRDGNLYLTRQFSIRYGAGLLDDIPAESFLLEVQRSLDYFERQMGQVPPASLYVCGDNISADKITVELQRGLSVPVKYLDLNSLVNLPQNSEEPLAHLAVAAMGGALREDTLAAFRVRGAAD
ncbi:hypothetical protein [Teredinibacter turnerae]|uniref:hypothetical protein n=1 Tax=Teredinibacter turnerae TaxID=2426 RepID=UPI0005F8969F|nr:hypothetical protein [Teredinibacter turnerae]